MSLECRQVLALTAFQFASLANLAQQSILTLRQNISIPWDSIRKAFQADKRAREKAESREQR
jgi:hypothetical protein